MWIFIKGVQVKNDFDSPRMSEKSKAKTGHHFALLGVPFQNVIILIFAKLRTVRRSAAKFNFPDQIYTVINYEFHHVAECQAAQGNVKLSKLESRAN